MLLAIDVGNTNIVIGLIDGGEIVNTVRLTTIKQTTWAECAMRIRYALEFLGAGSDKLDGAIISSVAPEVTGPICDAVRHLTGLECMVVGPGMKTGMNVRIDDPGTLAGDLVVGSVAAMEYYGTPTIILDLGTATTIVAVDSSKSFRGGAIIPGVNLSFGALSDSASLLPTISISAPEKVIGTNTVDCMRSGAVFGTAAMLDGMIDRMEEELGEKCRLVATGGLASTVTGLCRHSIICDDDLLLKGLWYLYQKNKRK